jgi:DNA-binding LacI/PurR family transcriptional regulator
LTTVAVPLTEMGEIAFSMVRKPAAARPRRRFVPSRLVVRESTAGVHEGVTVLKTANQRH